jgi:hypothetical protein
VTAGVLTTGGSLLEVFRRAGASLADVRQAMTATGRRRAAVTSADGRLLGLLCLKVSQTGFCSDQDVRARALSAGSYETVSCVAQM